MKITPTDKAAFDRVMAHYGLDADEIELCKQSYRDDHEAHRIGYAAMAALLPTPTPAEKHWVTPVLNGWPRA